MSNFIWPPVLAVTSFAYHSNGAVEARFGPQTWTFHVVSATAGTAASAANKVAVPITPSVSVDRMRMGNSSILKLVVRRGYRYLADANATSRTLHRVSRITNAIPARGDKVLERAQGRVAGGLGVMASTCRGDRYGG